MITITSKNCGFTKFSTSIRMRSIFLIMIIVMMIAAVPLIEWQSTTVRTSWPRKLEPTADRWEVSLFSGRNLSHHHQLLYYRWLEKWWLWWQNNKPSADRWEILLFSSRNCEESEDETNYDEDKREYDEIEGGEKMLMMVMVTIKKIN